MQRARPRLIHCSQMLGSAILDLLLKLLEICHMTFFSPEGVPTVYSLASSILMFDVLTCGFDNVEF